MQTPPGRCVTVTAHTPTQRQQPWSPPPGSADGRRPMLPLAVRPPVSSQAAPSCHCLQPPHRDVSRCAASARHVLSQCPAGASLPTYCPCCADTVRRVVPCCAIIKTYVPCAVPPLHATCFLRQLATALSAVLSRATPPPHGVSYIAELPRHGTTVPSLASSSPYCSLSRRCRTPRAS